MKTDAFAVIA